MSVLSSFTGLSVRKPILMSMILGAFLVFGVASFFALSIDLMPKFDLPYVTVQVAYPGAGPQEIETSVIKPMEEQLSTVAGIKSVTSTCMEGGGYIMLEFNADVNADIGAIDVKDKVDAILSRLPRDVKKPVVSKIDMNAQAILNLAVTGPQSPEELRRIADKVVKAEVQKVNGVASITISGGRQREIQIRLHKERVDAIGQSVAGVAAAIGAQSANTPGGHIVGGTQEYTVRVVGEFTSLEEVGMLRIPVLNKKQGAGSDEDKGYVILRTIADVVDTYKEVREAAHFNREASVGLSIQKNPDANTVSLANGVFRKIEKLEGMLPEGTKISIVQDRSQHIRDSVNEMYFNIIVGIVLTALMLWLFLGDWRLMLIATMVIPGSVLMTFLGMRLFGFTLNMVTLMAIGIAIGQLVTDAIIIIESIVRHRDSGMPIRQAAVVGTNEVIIAVIASALTHSAVFLPIAIMQGITGQIFKPLGITIVIAVMSSLLFSLTLTPMMASRLLKSRTPGESASRKKNFAAVVLAPLQRVYMVALEWCLDRPWITAGITLVVFIGTIVGIGPRVGKAFFPASDEGLISISVTMPSGASLERTNEVVKRIEERVCTIPDILSVYSSTGGEGSSAAINKGSLIVRLKSNKRSVEEQLKKTHGNHVAAFVKAYTTPPDRSASTDAVGNRIRSMLTDIPDAELVVKPARSMGGGRQAADVQVDISGDRMEDILALADSVRVRAVALPQLADVRLTWQEAKPEVRFVPDRMKLDEYGITIGTLGMSIRNALSGTQTGVFRDGGDEYDITAVLDERDRTTVDDIARITVPTGKGLVRISELAKITFEKGAASIDRKNRQRLVSVTANVTSGASGTVTGLLQTACKTIPENSGAHLSFGGDEEQRREMFGQLMTALLLAVILVYMVLAGSIESLTQPILMMLTLPLGLIGVLWALFITGSSISMISMMSMIMLIGVVVNNAILLLDYAYQKVREGMSIREAIVNACETKFIALIMMNLAIILSSMPQALAVGTISSPFAITAIGGVIVSTMMTFFVIPVTFMATAKAPKPHHR